jgi:hypothetical protein
LLQNDFTPPPEIYKTKVVKNDTVSYGMNMWIKQPTEFDMDPEQGGGDLAPNQTFSSQPWGTTGCPPHRKEHIMDYILANMKSVVYCRYGLDYLHDFPISDELAIGSYRINLDHLIFQRQKNIDSDNNNSILSLSFLKQRSQVEMNKQIQLALA